MSLARSIVYRQGTTGAEEPDNLCKGRLALLEARLEEATGLLKKAIALNPTEDSPHLLLGEIYTRRGNLCAARDELRQALRCKIRPKNAEVARHIIAELNEKIGSE